MSDEKQRSENGYNPGPLVRNWIFVKSFRFYLILVFKN